MIEMGKLCDFMALSLSYIHESKEPIGKVTFLRTASSARLKKGNCFLLLKVLGSANRNWSQFLKKPW